MKVEELLNVARAEVGYIGKRSNKDLDDPVANQIGLYNKYARDLWMDGAPDHYYNGNKNGFSYCTVFADWIFWVTAGRNKEEAIKVKPYNVLNAGVTWARKAFGDVNRLGNYPKVGACVFFKDKSGELCHIGIVESVSDDTITTIEGNVGKKVVRKSYKLNDNYINDYGYPFYEEEPEPPQPTEEWETVAEWPGKEGSYRLQYKK